MEILPVAADKPKRKARQSKTQLLDPAQVGCDFCALKATWPDLHNPCMPVTGNQKNAEILILGEAPGKNEDFEGKIFVGASGKVLRAQIPRRHLDRIAFQNTVRCRPEANRTPTTAEIHACSIHLEADAERLPVKAILGAGNVPLHAFAPEFQILKIHGTKFPVRLGSKVVWYYPVMHPAFVLRNEQESGGRVRPIFDNDIKNFFAEVDKWEAPQIVRLSPDDVIIPRSRGEAEALIAKMADPIAVDLETNSLYPYKLGSKILTASFSDGTTTIAFSVAHPEWLNPWGLELLLDTVRRRPWVAHNVNFELSWFRFFAPGEAFNNYDDTMALARLYHKRESLLSLEVQSRIHLGVNVKKLANVNSAKLENYTLDQILKYNGLDTMATAPIYRLLRKKVDNVNYERLLRTIDSCVGMELMGLPVSLPFARKLKAEWGELAARQIVDVQASQEVVAYSRDTESEFNIASSRQLAKVLDTYTDIELPKTAKGNLSTNKAVLSKAAETNGLVRSVLDYREAIKLETTYIDHVLEVPNIYPDGMLHPGYTVLLTSTGRLSSTNPNCFPPEVEVLTRVGWKRWDAVSSDDDLAQYDLQTSAIDFTRPLHLIDQPFTGQLIRLRTELHLDMICTEDHGFYVRPRRARDYQRVTAVELPGDCQLPQAGHYNGTNNLRSTQVALIAAFQADAEYREKTDGSIIWEFAYQRKQDRLRAALLEEQIQFREAPCRPEKGPNYRRFHVSRSDVPDWLADKKHYGSWLLNYDQATLQLFANEVWLWDGSSTRNNDFCTGEDQDADWVQILLTLTGQAATKRRRASTPSGTKFVTARHKDCCWTTNSVKESIDHDGRVYCATMPKGTVIVRYNGRAVVTGQSQNFPRRRNGHIRNMIEVPPGFSMLAFDYAQLEARVLAMASKDRALCESIVSGRDIHSDWRDHLLDMYPEFLYRVMELHNLDDSVSEKELLKAARDRVKNMFVFASFYGASAASCAEAMGVPLSTLEELAIMFWSEFAGVKTWLKARRTEYQQTGTISTLTGRQRYQVLHKFNEPINGPIQGTAADIVAEAMNDMTLLSRKLADPYLHSRVQVHDDLMFIVPEDRVEYYVDTIHPVLTKLRFDWQIVPLAVEGKVGTKWGELTEFGVFTGEYNR